MKPFNIVRNMPRGFTLILGLIICGILGCDGGSSSTSTTPTSSALPAFPHVVSGDQRYLRDQKGVPFPILGRTAWFITSLSETEFKTFIDDTAAKGYNAIEFHVVNHDFRGNNPPLNGNGDLPFLQRLNGSSWNGSLSYGSDIATLAPDFTTPNEAYWSFVDGLLAYCESKGILVFLFPAYVGFANTDQGWMNEMVANGAPKMQSYGAWIATRYKNQKNLVWMAGGDMMTFDASQTAVESSLITGLKNVANQQSVFFSAHWMRGSIATDQPDFGSQMTLNGTYANSLDINNQGRRAYVRSPTIPSFCWRSLMTKRALMAMASIWTPPSRSGGSNGGVGYRTSAAISLATATSGRSIPAGRRT